MKRKSRPCCLKKVNRYQKGKRSERKAKAYYEAMGYEVETVRYDKWRANKDYFGLWDLICVGPIDIRFVQVKTNQKPTEEWQEKATNWGPNHPTVVKEYVVYRDYARKGNCPSARVTLGPNS